ncbi:unnamed protein product [Blepharisma stoltei]|uniref:Uncharacterized protein n=1 Tax=Blepharisma stoltei TaxID=1481888 RepID=A0AAU9JAC1_9CILI|nr:unnamed protein product [Blepharisma stoltei]
MESTNFQSLSSDDEEASVRTVEIRRELENLKELMDKAKRRHPTKALQSFSSQNLPNQSQAKHLSSSENIHEILLQYSKGPQIYSLLANLCTSYKIPLNIPETLLFISSIQYPIFLYTNKGYVYSEISDNSIDSFFDKVENISHNYHGNQNYPIFIHIAMNDRVRLCFSKSEARELFMNCPHYTHRLQRFIPPSTNFASKIRVHWTSGNKTSKMFFMSNTTQIVLKQYKSKIPPPPVGKIRKPLIISHTYSEKLLETSVSLSMPFKAIRRNISKTRQSSPHSMIFKDSDNSPDETNTSFFPKVRKSHKRVFSVGDFSTNNIIDQNPQEIDSSKFIVKSDNYSQVNVVISSQPIPEINHELKTITSLINTFILKKQNYLDELLIDFIKDSKEKFVFLSCKRYKVKGEQPREIFSTKKDSSKSNFKVAFPDIVINNISEQTTPGRDREMEEKLQKARMTAHKEAISIDQTQSMIEQKSSEMEIKRDVNLSLEEISELNKDNYLVQRKSDKLGRIPYNIIGIMPHNKTNQLISFIEKQKEPALKPLRHKERSKNLFWIGSDQISPIKYTEIMSKSIDKIAKHFDKRKKQAEEGKKGTNKNENII